MTHRECRAFRFYAITIIVVCVFYDYFFFSSFFIPERKRLYDNITAYARILFKVNGIGSKMLTTRTLITFCLKISPV